MTSAIRDLSPQAPISPNYSCCVTLRHDKHDVSCESWRDVCCAVLVLICRTTKKQY